MRTRRLGKKTALRTRVARAALVGSWLAVAACTGVEGDVLSPLPPPTPIATIDGGPPDGAPTARCTLQVLSTQRCVDLMTWIAKTQAICSSLGLIPGRLALTEPCPMRTGQGVRFECCPARICTPRALGEATSCKDALTWRSAAALDCQKRGEEASLMSLIDPCGDGSIRRYRTLKYRCCTADPSTSSTPL